MRTHASHRPLQALSAGPAVLRVHVDVGFVRRRHTGIANDTDSISMQVRERIRIARPAERAGSREPPRGTQVVGAAATGARGADVFGKNRRGTGSGLETKDSDEGEWYRRADGCPVGF